MSTKSLDLSLPAKRHQRNLSNDLTLLPGKEQSKVKLDVNKIQSYEDVGEKLIEDRLLLTALELYAELGEAGYELSCLKQFFSNPGNFEKSAQTDVSQFLVRSLSQTTLDSLDFPPPSEDGDRPGDRVAILEFELRKAKETITALRENLTLQAELDNVSTRSDTESSNSQPNAVSAHITHHQEPLKAYEQRAINFLVHEYLLSHGYRLSSITFGDENPEQDFENWDDVGLNVERPPDLVTLFRHRTRPLIQSQNTQTEETGTQTSETSQPSAIADAPSISSPEYPSHNKNIQPKAEDSSLEQIEPQMTLQESTSESDCSRNGHQNVTTVQTQASQPVAHSDLPNSSTHLQHSARALKEELQHSVEDVRQKLHSFFSKSHPLSVDSKTVPSTTSQNAKQLDIPPHSTFSSK